MFFTLNTILKPPDILPPHMYSTEHYNNLVNFFNSKIQQIPKHLASESLFMPILLLQSHAVFCNPPTSTFSRFLLPAVTEISAIIQKSKPSTLQLDHLVTYLVKTCLPSLPPFIIDIAYSPLGQATSLLTPLIKKSICD